MKSEWKVSRNYVGGKTLFGVYRIRDIEKIDHSGNRETKGYFETREEAKHIAEYLNEMEEKEEFCQNELWAIVKRINPKVTGLSFKTLASTEEVHIFFENRTHYRVNVTGNSLAAIASSVIEVIE